MELKYYRKGDYLYPNLVLEPEVTEPIGKYGLLRKAYLKEHKPDWYQSMRLTGKLDRHLLEIDKAAQSRVEQIVNRLLTADPAPNKETDQMGWTAHMNSLTAQAEEIVMSDLIYC